MPCFGSLSVASSTPYSVLESFHCKPNLLSPMTSYSLPPYLPLQESSRRTSDGWICAFFTPQRLHAAQPVHRQLILPQKFCWDICKGPISACPLISIASYVTLPCAADPKNPYKRVKTPHRLYTALIVNRELEIMMLLCQRFNRWRRIKQSPAATAHEVGSRRFFLSTAPYMEWICGWSIARMRPNRISFCLFEKVRMLWLSFFLRHSWAHIGYFHNQSRPTIAFVLLQIYGLWFLSFHWVGKTCHYFKPIPASSWKICFLVHSGQNYLYHD